MAGAIAPPTMCWLTPIAMLQESPTVMDAAVTFHIADTPADLTDLASAVRGSVVRPTDEAYEQDRQVFAVTDHPLRTPEARVTHDGRYLVLVLDEGTLSNGISVMTLAR